MRDWLRFYVRREFRTMKLIRGIVRQEKLKEVMDKLTGVVTGLTVMEARGYGHQAARTASYRGAQYVAPLPRVMIEILIDDDRIDDVLKILIETARTGEIGDGRIFVLPVEQTYHIRTGFLD